MKLESFAITPPESSAISQYSRAQLASGAVIVKASITTLFKYQPGSVILCPACFNEYNLELIWNNDGKTSSGYHCICGAHFANSEALHLVFGHLSPK